MATAIADILQQQGFELARQRKHKVWRREDGLTFVTPSTPSDVRWERAALSTLCRALGTTKSQLLGRTKRAPVQTAVTEQAPVETQTAVEVARDTPADTEVEAVEVAKVEWTKSEVKKLNRWQKNEGQRRQQLVKKLQRLIGEVTLVHDALFAGEFDDNIFPLFYATSLLFHLIRRWGWKVSLCAAELTFEGGKKLPIPVILADGWYVDVLHGVFSKSSYDANERHVDVLSEIAVTLEGMEDFYEWGKSYSQKAKGPSA